MRPKITISYLPIKYYAYFQWFLVGLYKKENEGVLSVHFKLNLLYKVFYFYCPTIVQKVLIKYFSNLICRNEIPVIRGAYLNEDNSISFCYETNDSPFWFSEKDLLDVQYYFKAQHPIEFCKNGFELTKNVKIPFPDYLFNNLNKIRPSMIGPRMLCIGIKKETLLSAYQHFIKNANCQKDMFLMAYFGSDHFEDLKKKEDHSIDFNVESSLMFHFKDFISHPNVKRGVLHQYLENSSKLIDSRIISQGSTPISLQNFQKHVSRFKYNLNVSGFRMSIPNRFIDSFSVGTCIVTDSLKVKWYKPFTCEVVELGDMGYNKTDEINWNDIYKRLDSLENPNCLNILNKFKYAWSPESFLDYVLNEINEKSES